MTGNRRSLGAIVAPVMLCSTGCGPAAVHIRAADQNPVPDSASYDDRPWANVLRENVKDDLVDYQHLAAHRQPLDEYLALLAVVSPDHTPDQFPTREARLCYYLNAFNAGVLAAVLDAGVPDTVHSTLRGAFEQRYHLLAGQRWTRLAELRERAWTEAAGDARVLFALCDAAVGSPPLPDLPLRPEGIEEQLRLLARRAMDNSRIVTVDHENQTLNVATELFSQRDRFMQDYRRRTGAREATLLSALLQYAGQPRRDWFNTAVGYPLRLIPFDRRLNRWDL